MQRFVSINNFQVSNLTKSLCFCAPKGITNKITSAVTVDANSGWNGACTYFLSSEACAAFPSMNGFSISGISSFSADCIANITVPALAPLTTEQVKAFGDVNAKSCSGFHYEQLRAINASKWPGWSGACVANLQDDYWSAGGITLVQALSMSSDGLSGVSASRFYRLVSNFGDTIGNIVA
jgi:hypothetical protein